MMTSQMTSQISLMLLSEVKGRFSHIQSTHIYRAKGQDIEISGISTMI